MKGFVETFNLKRLAENRMKELVQKYDLNENDFIIFYDNEWVLFYDP